MIKRTIPTLLLASAMMITIVGCSGAATEENTTEIEEASDSNSDNTNHELTDDAFLYNGNKISILNDATITLGNLGDYDADRSSTGSDYKNYSFDNGKIDFATNVIDGKEAPVDIGIFSPDIKTSRDVGVGSTKDEITGAYGDPDTKTDDGLIYTIEYQFDTYNITFRFDDTKAKVDMVLYTNSYYHSKTAFS